MKRNLFVIFLLAMLTTPLATTTQASVPKIQPLTADGCKGPTHPTIDGDKAEKLFGLNWKLSAIPINPGIKQRIQVLKNGQTVVWLYPSRGDTLCMPSATAGEAIVMSPFEPTAAEASGQSEGGTLSEVKTETNLLTAIWEKWKGLGWFARWILTPLIGLIFLLLILNWLIPKKEDNVHQTSVSDLEEELLKDPVTSGTPYVRGGIEPSDTASLKLFFDRQAIADFIDRNPEAISSNVRVERIGPIQSGMIFGAGFVGYMGEGKKPRRIEEPGIPAYRAKYKFLADGSEAFVITLQACMNPVYSGGETFEGFTFTPDKTTDDNCRGKGTTRAQEEEALPLQVLDLTAIEPIVAETLPEEDVEEPEFSSGASISGGHRARRFQGSFREWGEGGDGF